jgi:hypothetical protein
MEQKDPPGQTLLHAPQLNGSLVSSTHALPQEEKPVAHTQWLALHIMSTPHPRLHPPQLAGSDVRSTQPTPGQSVCPLAQPQTPPEQVSPVGQGLPHPPQWAGSVCVSTQSGSPRESVHRAREPHELAQTPAAQTWPAWQLSPQLPQLRPSLARSTQLPPQLISPPGQLVRQFPPAHTSPFVQALPQAPQLSASVANEAQ